MQLKLKETARTMLLQLKVQAMFSGDDEKQCTGMTKDTLSQLIRAHHAEVAFVHDEELAAFTAEAWEEAQPDSSAKGITHSAFTAWYTEFLESIERYKANPTAWASRAHDVSSSGVSQFENDGPWSVPMNGLQDALEAAWAKGRTPLLVDMTADGARGDATPLEIFYSYSGDRLLDMKRMVVEVDVKNNKTAEEALDDARAKLVVAMRRGYKLVFMLGNAAPKLHSRFTSKAHLPYVLLEDNAQVQRAVGADWRTVEWSRELLTEADQIYMVHARGSHSTRRCGCARARARAPLLSVPHRVWCAQVHPDFNVLVITRFAPADYESFLGKELPLASMQHIKVTRAP